ncbi:MAG: hypothetical protein RI924_1525, partial [Bacteroidota bacterium]
AWGGLNNAKSYMDYDNFEYPGGSMSKSELNRIIANYIGKFSGTLLCTPSL